MDSATRGISSSPRSRGLPAKRSDGDQASRRTIFDHACIWPRSNRPRISCSRSVETTLLLPWKLRTCALRARWRACLPNRRSAPGCRARRIREPTLKSHITRSGRCLSSTSRSARIEPGARVSSKSTTTGIRRAPGRAACCAFRDAAVDGVRDDAHALRMPRLRGRQDRPFAVRRRVVHEDHLDAGHVLVEDGGDAGLDVGARRRRAPGC